MLKRYVNKIVILIYAWFYGLNKKNSKDKVIYIPFFGHIGDMVMFLDNMMAYCDRFSREKGYNLILGCRNEVKGFLQAIGMGDDITFSELTREKLQTDFVYFRKKCREINGYRPQTVLHVRAYNKWEDTFIYAICADQKVIAETSMSDPHGFIGKYFHGHAYTAVIPCDRSLDQLTCYGGPIKWMGLTDYKSKIARLPKLETAMELPQKPFIVVSPGASVPNKCWPTERYISLVDYITTVYDRNVVLCGAGRDAVIAEEIEKASEKKDRVYNLAGKTSMKDWIAIIQQAECVISNESGAAHIASASCIPAVCIAAQNYGDTFLPYRPEDKREDDVYPTIVRLNKLPCSYCKETTTEHAALSYKDEACKKCVAEHGVIRCVYEVSFEMVKDAFDRFMISTEEIKGK